MIAQGRILVLFALACASGLLPSPVGAAGHDPPSTLTNGTTSSRPLTIATRAPPAKNSKLWYQLSLLAGAASQAQAAGKGLAPSDASLPPTLRASIEAHQLRLDDSGNVEVYIAVDNTSRAMRGSLIAHGAQMERVDEKARLVQARVPPARLPEIASLPGVTDVRPPDYAVTEAGSIESEGDAVVRASDLRSYLPSIDGTGIVVGVISDGIAGLAESESSGDLPAVDTTTCNTAGDDPGAHGAEGTAMLEIVHDIAPGASLMFGNFGFGTGLDFNAAVNCLAQNADIIVDDIAFYGAGPYDGSSYISENTAAALNGSGRIRGYYTAAGNEAVRHYQGPFVDSGFSIAAGGDTWTTQEFRATTTPYPTDDAGLVPSPAPFDRFRLVAGGSATITLVWNDSWGSSANDYDLFFGTTSGIFACSMNPQTGAEPPVESCSVSNDSLMPQDIDIYIANYLGVADPRVFDLFLLCNGCLALSNGNYLDFDTPGSSVGNQADAGGSPVSVMAVGAVRYSSPDSIERFSGLGPTENARTKPDLVGPDAVCVTGHGGFLSSSSTCQTTGRRFLGTSAAVPHIAGVAALLLQCTPSLTRLTLRDRLISYSTDLGAFGPDNVFGYGRPDVYAAAVAANTCGLPTPTPTPTQTDTPTPSETPTPDLSITPTPTPPVAAGDANCDAAVDAIDAALILQYAAGLLPALPCPQTADVNGDGGIDPIDAALVLQFVAGLISQL